MEVVFVLLRDLSSTKLESALLVICRSISHIQPKNVFHVPMDLSIPLWPGNVWKSIAEAKKYSQNKLNLANVETPPWNTSPAMVFVPSVLKDNTKRMDNANLAPMKEFTIWLFKDVFAMKPKVNIGMDKLAFSVLIQNIGISEIWNAKPVHTNKYTISWTVSVNTVLLRTLTSMDCTAQYVPTTKFTTAQRIRVSHVPGAKCTMLRKWNVCVLRNILTKLTLDVSNAIYLITLMPKASLVYLVQRIKFTINHLHLVWNVLQLSQFPMELIACLVLQVSFSMWLWKNVKLAHKIKCTMLQLVSVNVLRTCHTSMETHAYLVISQNISIYQIQSVNNAQPISCTTQL